MSRTRASNFTNISFLSMERFYCLFANILRFRFKKYDDDVEHPSLIFCGKLYAKEALDFHLCLHFKVPELDL